MGTAEERTDWPKLDWETGEGKSYVIPALEIGGFLLGLNQFNRHVIDSKEYGSDGHSIWKNLSGPLVIDRDPFSINRLGHPYQGNIYFGFARSAGLDFWRSLAYRLGGSLLWEIAGETSPPALNDHINTAIGGAFIGEAAFRMASLLLEGGGEKPGFWRELGADPIRTALYHEPQNLPSDLSYHQQVLVLTFLDHSPSALLEVPLPLLRNVGCRQV